MNIEIDKKIDEYLKGKLTASEIDGLWADILANPEYLGHLKTEAQLMAYYSKRMPVQVADNRIKMRKSMIVSIAAVTVFVVALMWALLLDTGVHPPQAINRIDVFEMETPAVTRSDNELIAESGLILLEGYDLVLDGNDPDAMARFRDVIENYPDSESAVFAKLNLGIIAYNTQDFESALSHFESASAAEADTDEMIRQKILWFTANAALLTENMETAAVYSRDASNLNGYYTEKASEFYASMQAYLKQ
ncbi:MAG: tetratricopeptide repeat protein [Rhodothermaceae bacterium]|nr:tetratricopeptide repeat protein [Rhodothermaceae bacterium]